MEMPNPEVETPRVPEPPPGVRKPTPSPTRLPSIIVGLVIAFVAGLSIWYLARPQPLLVQARWMRRGSTLQHGLMDALRRYLSSAARTSRPEHLA